MPQEPDSPKPSLGAGSQNLQAKVFPASPLSATLEKVATLKGAIAELEKVRLAIVANARNFQSYPVAREAMTKLAATVTKRIVDHKTELERIENESTSASQ